MRTTASDRRVQQSETARPIRRWFPGPELAAALLCAFFLVDSARAEVTVEGEPASVRVQAKQANAGEILDALGAAFDLRYRASVALDRPVAENFSGPLERVIARVLDGYDYVVKHSSDAVDIAVYARRDGAPGAAMPNPPATNVWQGGVPLPATPIAAGTTPWQSSNSRTKRGQGH